MKKIFLSAVAVLAFGFTNAQGVKFGAKAALNVSTLTGDVENVSSLLGFQVGGFAEIKLSEKFAVQPELMYSTQGAKSSYTESSGGASLKLESKSKLSYLNIPVMAKYFVTPKFSLEFGPQIGFLMSAKQDISSTGTFGGVSVSESESIDIKDKTSSVDFSINFGTGYDFTENLTVGLRYNLGLTNVVDIKDSKDSIKNGVLSVSLGYKF
jgi:long-subunit fatty acid transport protein